jgi:hypothetical protein
LLRDQGLGFHRRSSTGFCHPCSISRAIFPTAKLNSAMPACNPDFFTDG